MHINPSAKQEQRRICTEVSAYVDRSDSYAFFNLLTSSVLLDQVESLIPAHRERLYPPTETLSMFLGQVLASDHSCQRAVDETTVRRLNAGLRPSSTNTGGYCSARSRLPLPMVQSLARYTGRAISRLAPEAWRWHGRRVRIVDGTTMTLPDTTDNRTAFPQSRAQKAGIGFPICRMVGIMCLGSGAVLNVAIGPCVGKGSGEQSLLRTMLDSTLERGDVLLGDAYYPTYLLLNAMQERGIDGVFEQHGSRGTVSDFRCGTRLGKLDHLIKILKPKKRPAWMTEEDFQRVPASMIVRELRVGHKTLITTLICPLTTPSADLAQLYQERWHVELDFRNIKTTMKMDRLSCTTPEMAIKEIWVYMLAYNLIRLMMAQAAVLAGIEPRQISFKHTVQIWIAWSACNFAINCGDRLHSLFVLIAQQRVGNRPGRIEPRAVKRRPKSYPLLMQKRELARAKVKKYGHPKKAK